MRIQMLAFLLFLQAFAACQQDQEKVLPVEANIRFSTEADGPDKTPPITANIIFKSTDSGQNWQDISAGLPADAGIGCVYVDGDEVFLGADNGLYHSDASAAALVWEKELWMNKSISNVLPGRSGPYLSSYGSGIFQGIPGTGIWLPVYTTLKEHTNSVRTLLETSDGTILVGCDSGIFRSTDSGQTWKKVFEDDMILDIVASNGVLMAGGYKGVQRSTDGGEHWENVLNENILIKKTGVLNGRFVAVFGCKDPRIPTPGGITSRLRVSPDGGKTWKRLEKALLPLQDVYDMDESLSKVLDIYEVVQTGDTLFCSFNTGIYRSADQGNTWKLVLPTTDGKRFKLTVSGQTVYALAIMEGC